MNYFKNGQISNVAEDNWGGSVPIVRAEHKENFTQILNNLLNDERLSYGARGLMAHALTHYDDWVFNGEDYFITELDKKTKVRSCIKELVQHGYLKRIANRNEKGVFQGYKYVFHEKPFLDLPFSEKPILDKPNSDNHNMDKGTENTDTEPFLDFPFSDKPFLDKPFSENRKLNNTNITNTNIYIGLTFIDDVIDKVKITQDQYNALVNKHGKELVNNQILGLDSYIVNGKGAKYKDHYRVLNTWCNKNKNMNINKSKSITYATNKEAMEIYK